MLYSINVFVFFFLCFLDNELIPLEDIDEDESPFLTLEEAEKLAFEKKEKAHSKKWAQESKNQVIFKLVKILCILIIIIFLGNFYSISFNIRRNLQV
jgi:hypothetical protein